MVLAANKKDLVTDDASGVVPPRFGKQMAERFDASFMETSAFTGENVNPAFELICQRILDQKSGGDSGRATPGSNDNPGPGKSL